jgi:RNA polymerase-binding transcription factor DksA
VTELSAEEPLAALSAHRLEEIDHALARAAHGQLGRCEKCGNDIPLGRLRALPGAVLCVRCAAANPGVAR